LSAKKYVFIVCPNQAGSTVIYRYLGRCEKAVKLGSEGQLLYGDAGPINMLGEVSEEYFSFYPEVFSNDAKYDWNRIKRAWENNWRQEARNQKKKDPCVFIEKSPPNVFRAHLLQRHFENSYFIFSIRNPYAMCEGMKRHIGYPVEKGAEHWARCARMQVLNIYEFANQKRNVMLFYKYEDLCSNPERVKEDIVSLIPELSDLNLGKNIAVHSINDMAGMREKKLSNLNEKQFKNLSQEDADKITAVLKNYKDEMEIFNYDYR